LYQLQYESLVVFRIVTGISIPSLPLLLVIFCVRQQFQQHRNLLLAVDQGEQAIFVPPDIKNRDNDMG
jgi:hypothetical protein